MVEKSRSQPKSNSDVKPISLEFSHPRDNLHFYIGPLGIHIAHEAKRLEKCASDEEQLRVLQNGAKWVPRQIEMAEISAKGMSRWLRYGMMDAAGPFEARVREVLGQLNTAYRRPEELVENGNSCALFRKCHEEIAAIEIKLCATPLDPNDNAKSMWPIIIAVFHQRLKKVASGLDILTSKAGATAETMADLRKEIEAAIEALDDVLGSVQAQLANALYIYDQYRWGIDVLTTYLRVLACFLPEYEPAHRAVVTDTLNHLRLLLAVLGISKKPELSPDDHARFWTEYPVEAKEMRIPRPTKRETTRLVETDSGVVSEDDSLAPSQAHAESSTEAANVSIREPGSSDTRSKSVPVDGAINAVCPNPSQPEFVLSPDARSLRDRKKITSHFETPLPTLVV